MEYGIEEEGPYVIRQIWGGIKLFRCEGCWYGRYDESGIRGCQVGEDGEEGTEIKGVGTCAK